MTEIYQFNRIVRDYKIFGLSREELNRNPFYSVHGHWSEVKNCAYCGSVLTTYQGPCLPKDCISMYLHLCYRCHWWRAMMRVFDKMDDYEYISLMTKNVASSDDVPIAELRMYLMKNWGSRKIISAKIMEQTVAAIFKNLYNCEVHYTTNSVYGKDGGIDLVLVKNENGITAAIQVKRRQTDKPESVRCIREFIGSLAQSKYNHGYFVTTADRFSPDATVECNNSKKYLASRNIEISLINGNHLYEMLTKCEIKTKGAIQLENFLNELSPQYWCDVSDFSKKILSNQIIESLNS